ncbi:MAG: hypothetical protein ACKV2O_12575 [Acidimicrobiales bacterium]
MSTPVAPQRTLPVPRSRLVLRALRRHCPQCGSGGYFVSWFKLALRCPRCGLASERVAGHFVGAVGVNTMVTFGLLLVALLGGTWALYPEVRFLPLVAICGTVALATPVLFWPFSQTLWTAADLAMRPATESELDPRYTDQF